MAAPVGGRGARVWLRAIPMVLTSLLCAGSIWAAPSISVIPSQSGPEDGLIGPIAFTISDPIMPADQLRVSATTSAPGIFPAGSIVLGGTGADRTITLRPATNTFGNVTVSITVSNATQGLTRTFPVSVVAVNDPPTLDPILNQGMLNTDSGIWVYFSGVTSGAANESDFLSVTVVSNSNAGLFASPPFVSYSSPFQWGNIFFQPKSNAVGIATITMRVDDGRASNNLAHREFTIIVTNHLVDLTIWGTYANPSPAGLSNVLTYELQVYNHGPSNAAEVVLTDILPTNTVFLSASVLGDGPPNACVHTAGIITCHLGTIPRFELATLRFAVLPTTDGLLSNRISVVSAQVDRNLQDNSTTTLTPVIRGADLEIFAPDLPVALLVGSNLTFSIQVTNHGLYTATNSLIYFGIPETFQLVSLVSSHGSCSNGSSGIVCGLGDLVVGALAEIQATVRPLSVGDAWAQVSAYSDTPDAQYNNNYHYSSSFAARAISEATSAGAIQLPIQGAANPYPSSITVSGLTGRVHRVVVTLHALTHPNPGQLDILLVGPTGRKTLLFSDIVNTGPANDVTLTFDDLYPQIPTDAVLSSGRYAPTDYGDLDDELDPFPAPVPSGRPWVFLDVFRDSDPNGLWSLYVVDDTPGGGTGVLEGGWSLTIGTGEGDLAKTATFRGIVTTGSPGGGPGGKFTELRRPVINNSGQVGFVGTVEITTPEGWTDSATGMWTARGWQDVRRLAGRGDTPPGVDDGWQFYFDPEFAAPTLDDAGVMGITAIVSDPDLGFESFGIWSGTDSNDLANLALNGGVVPGAGEDWTFEELFSPYASDAGVFAFRGAATDRFSGDRFTGYWIGPNRTNLTLLVRSGQPAPGVDGHFQDLPEADMAPPVFDANGRLAFRAEAFSDFDQTPGIWIGGAGLELRLVAVGGTSVPGFPELRLSRDSSSWSLLGCDSTGRVYFRADVTSEFGPVFSGIWAANDPSDLELLFSTGTPVFVGTNRVVFDHFGCPLVSPDGTVMFAASYMDGNGQTIGALWKGHGAGDLMLVAYDGQPLSGFTVNAKLRDLLIDCPIRAVNRLGYFVFSSGVEFANSEFAHGIFVVDPTGSVAPIVRTGEIVEVTPGNFQRIWELSTLINFHDSGPDRSGGRRIFNDALELAVWAGFESGGTSIAIAQFGSASVEGHVWYDRTANSVRDSDDPGVPQTRVDIFSAGADGQPGGGDDTLVASRLTDQEGHYRLGVARAGRYFLQFSLPLGFGFASKNQGADDSVDSDADPVNGRTDVFVLGATTRATGVDAGLVSGFAVGDTQVAEGDSGQRAMTFTVALGVPRRSPASVNFATAPGTAQSGVDFTPATGTLNFNPGEATKTFTVMIEGDLLLENVETVQVNLSGAVNAPIVRGQGIGRIIDDDPAPPTPAQPRPPHRSVLQRQNVELGWRSTRTRELLTNGGFELGSFAGWTVEPSGFSNQGFLLFDEPESAPEGRYFAASREDLSQPRILSRRVLMPNQLRTARLSWWQRVGAVDGFGPNRQFRVEVRDAAGQTLAVVYQAGLADADFEWRDASADLGQFSGRLIEIAFIVESPSYSLDVRLDVVRLEVDDTADTTFDVYFGTEPVPGAAQFQGTTPSPVWPLPPLAPLTTYYWQIVARRADVAVPGPVWQFTTRRNVTNDFVHTYSAMEEIVIPDLGDDGRAWPYPSTISLRHLPGAVANATVTLHGLSHSYPDDLEVLLVGPNGARIVLLRGVGEGIPVDNLTLTFEDAAPFWLPEAGPLRTGTFKPGDFGPGNDPLPPPAPAGPYRASLAQLNESSPNGNWSLFVYDRFSFEDGGAIAEGWSLSLTLLQADSDGDGLPDDYEVVNELNPLDALDGATDLDGDGHTLGQEYLAGTYPDNPDSVLRIRSVRLEGDDAVLDISSGIGRDYRIERLSMTNGLGVLIATLPGGDNGLIVRDFGARALPHAFYRVQAAPAANPFDPDLPPGPEHFRAQADYLVNTSFNRLFYVTEEVFALRGLDNNLILEGRVIDPGDGSIVERFRIALTGVLGPGQFIVSTPGTASASYSRRPFPGPQFDFATYQVADGGNVLVDILTNEIVAGRFTLNLSDTQDASRRIQVTGSFRAFVE